jgi:ferredoxin
VSGQEHLHPITDDERETLEDICGVDPDSHRLACRARLTGPVVVDIVDQ